MLETNTYQTPKSLRGALSGIAEQAIKNGSFLLADQISAVLLEIAPTWPQWLEIRCSALVAMGLKAEAEAKLRQCLEIFPSSQKSLETLMDLLNERGEWYSVLELAASQQLSANCKVQLTLACDKIAGSGDFQTALDGLLRLVALKVEDSDVYVRASRLCVATGALDINDLVLGTLRETKPNNVYGHLSEVHRLMAEARFPDAQAALLRLGEKFPDSPVILASLCEISIDMHDGPSALKFASALEGRLPGRKIRDLQIRAEAAAGNWSAVKKLCDGMDAAHSSTKDRVLSIYSRIYLGKADEALQLCDEYLAVEKETVSKGRWLHVSKQVASFYLKKGKFSTDPDYRFEGVPADIPTEEKIQMLWVGGDLSPIEKLSISSWLQNGFHVDLYTYGDVRDVPAGCNIRNAAEILPKEEIFAHSGATGRSKGSFAGFADVFRWHLLNKVGGFWSDCDIVCLKPFKLPQGLAIASEMARTFGADHMAITNCFFGGPPGHPMFRAACEKVVDVVPDELNWGEVGTQLIGQLVDEMDLEDSVLRSDAFNKISPYRMISAMRSLDVQNGLAELDNSWGLHLYNEVWRSHKISKSGPFVRDSLLHHLFARYGVEVDVTPEYPALRLADSA